VPPRNERPARQIFVHESVEKSLARELFPGALPFRTVETNALIVASSFDADLAASVESGARLLLLPDGKKNSLATSAHWFLRGAPIISPITSGTTTREMVLELQHFDLANDVVLNVPQLDSMNPLLMLWDTHDEKATVHTHGIVFETTIGKGKMLVSTARHRGSENAAGRWLLSILLDRLASDSPPTKRLPQTVWDYAKAKLRTDQTNLVQRTWKFKPDPKNEGLVQGWHLPKPETDVDWADIKIGAWWENQGYPSLDGWAWYRLWVQIPELWRGREAFLSFEGVDDVYELYVNGTAIGKGGDLETHKDALKERRSWDITRHVQPGERALISVRVYDWYGAGGIFRPVTLGTLPIKPDLDFLQ
jgi:hypothetical protein